MADSTVIKEFLVALGFKTDEAALKKFENGIVQATKVTFAFGAAIEYVAVSVSIGVARFASNLEALYFAAQRTHASATELRAFGRTAQGMGVSIEEATNSVENLQHFIRTNPGWQNALGDWFGVKTAVGESPVRMIQDIARAMRGMTEQQAIMRGGMAGLSELTVLMMRNPDFDKKFLNVFDRLRNAGFNTAAEHAHKFMETLRELGDWLVIIGTRIEDALQKKLGFSLQSVVTWLQQNQDWIIDRVVNIANWFLDAFNKILQWTLFNWPQIKAKITTAFFEIKWAWEMYLAPALEWIWNKFKSLDTASGGWLTTITLLLAALKLVGGTEIIGGVLGLAAAFVRVGAAITGVTTGLAVLSGYGLAKWFDEKFPNNPLAQLGHGLADAIQFANEQAAGGKPRMTAGEAMVDMIGMGLTREQAAGLAANFQRESSMNPQAENKGHFGLGQWDASRQADFKAWSGVDIHNSDAYTQMKFALYELFHGKEQLAGDALMAAAGNAGAAGFAMSRFYERHGNPFEDQARGEIAQHLSQQTNIYVQGSADPHTTADAVAQRQQRLNEAIMRTFAATVPGG